jgi:hypothetical protein
MTKKTQARKDRDRLAKELHIPFISREVQYNLEYQRRPDPLAGCSEAVRGAHSLYQEERIRQDLTFGQSTLKFA